MFILQKLNVDGDIHFPSVCRFCLSQVPLVAVDSFFYGKLVIAPLNILLYNVFTPHGPDLYGNIQAHTSLMYHFFIVLAKNGILT